MNYDKEHLSIINTNNFEIVDDKDLIIVDKKIAKSIANLNKKGYTTKFSCEGHFCGVYTYEQNNCDNYFLEQVENDNHCAVFHKHKDTFDYVSERRSTFIYIKFDKQYDFPNLPKGYILEQDTITHEVEFLDEFGNRRTGNNIMNEIEEYNKILEEWTNNLPNINVDL